MSITIKDIQKGDPREIADDAGYAAFHLVQTVRLACENENTVFPAGAIEGSIAGTLMLAEELLSIVIDGTELLQRDAKRGRHAEPAA